MIPNELPTHTALQLSTAVIRMNVFEVALRAQVLLLHDVTNLRVDANIVVLLLLFPHASQFLVLQNSDASFFIFTI